MVDPIATKAVTTGQDRPVASATSASQLAKTAVRPSAPQTDPGSKQLELSAVASEFGKSSPVDEKRVEEVKRAVRNGTYPIEPETIADRMLALKLYWSPKK